MLHHPVNSSAYGTTRHWRRASCRRNAVVVVGIADAAAGDRIYAQRSHPLSCDSERVCPSFIDGRLPGKTAPTSPFFRRSLALLALFAALVGVSRSAHRYDCRRAHASAETLASLPRASLTSPQPRLLALARARARARARVRQITSTAAKTRALATRSVHTQSSSSLAPRYHPTTFGTSAGSDYYLPPRRIYNERMSSQKDSLCYTGTATAAARCVSRSNLSMPGFGDSGTSTKSSSSSSSKSSCRGRWQRLKGGSVK